MKKLLLTIARLRSSGRGFTLVELLAAITILLILTSVALPLGPSAGAALS